MIRRANEVRFPTHSCIMSLSTLASISSLAQFTIQPIFLSDVSLAITFAVTVCIYACADWAASMNRMTSQFSLTLKIKRHPSYKCFFTGYTSMEFYPRHWFSGNFQNLLKYYHFACLSAPLPNTPNSTERQNSYPHKSCFSRKPNQKLQMVCI